MRKLALIFVFFAALLEAQNELTLRAVLPPSVPSINAVQMGTTGAAVYCYFVVANYPGGSVMSPQPSCVTNGNNTLSVSNFVNVGWTAVTGVTNYDVIRISALGPFPSSGACTSCAVTTGATATTFSDTGGATTNYTLAGFANANPTSVLRIQNVTYSAPRVELTLFPLQILNGNLYLGTVGASGPAGILHNIQQINCTLDNLEVGFTDVASAVNGLQVANAATGNSVLLSSANTGADANAPLGLSSNGTGAINFFTGNGARKQFAVVDTASAVNNLQVTGAPASTHPIFSAVGSDSAVGIDITTKGVFGAGPAATINSIRFFFGGNNEVLRVNCNTSVTCNGSGTTNFMTLGGALTGQTPYIRMSNSSDATVGLNVVTKAGGVFAVSDSGNTNPGLSVQGVASAVNGVFITPGATGNPVVIGTNVGDANIPIQIASRGTGSISFLTGNTARQQFQVIDSAGVIINNLTVTGAPSNFAPIMGIGTTTDANVGIQITPKGTGSITTTAPLVYGANIPNVSAATGQTLTAAQVLNQVLDRSGANAGQTDTFPTAAALVAGATGCIGNTAIEWTYRNRSANSITLSLAVAGITSATGNTLTIANATARQFIIQFNNCSSGFEAATVWSIGTSAF